MPFLIPVAQAIGSVIAAIAAAVTAAIVTIATTLSALLGPLLSSIVAGITWVGSTVMTVASTVAVEAWNAAVHLAGYIANIAEAWYNGAVYYWHELRDVLHAVIESVYFKVAIAVHSVALLVSSEYRAVWKKVMAELMQLSAALGFGAEFLMLAMRNSRNVVLGVSGILGRKYDLSEVTWLTSMTKFLERVNTKAQQYKKDPEELFNDLAEMIERPYVDVAGAYSSTILISVNKSVEFITTLSENFKKLGVDMDKLYDDLPKFIRDLIPDAFPKFMNEFNNFMSHNYWPAINMFNQKFQEFAGEINAAKSKAEEAFGKIKTTSQTIKEVKELPKAEQEALWGVMDQIQSEQRAVQGLALLSYFAPISDKFQQQLKTPVPTTPAPSFLNFEGAYKTPEQVPQVFGAGTPFVGDY